MSDRPRTVLVTAHANRKSDPVYHLADGDGQPRCVSDADETYHSVARPEVPDRFRLCRTCDPQTHVSSGEGAVCDLLADLDPDDVGESETA